MDIRAEVVKIVNKVMGKTLFLDVCFFDGNIVASLKQIDYLQKTYDFKGSPLEFITVKSFSEFFDTVKRYSVDFNEDIKSFSSRLLLNFHGDILKNHYFSKTDAVKVVNRLKSNINQNFEFNIDNFENDKISHIKIFSEVARALNSLGAADGRVLKVRLSDSELLNVLIQAINESDGESIIGKSLNILNLPKAGKDVIHFLTVLERVFKIKIPYNEVGNADIFTNVYKWVKLQRPDISFNKAAIEREITSIAAKVFNDTNMILAMAGKVENYKDAAVPFESPAGGQTPSPEKAHAEDARPAYAHALPGDNSIDSMLAMSQALLAKGFELKKPKGLTAKMENKFISDIEKKFKITFSMMELFELSGFNSIVKAVEKLVKKQKVNERYPGLLPQNDLDTFVKAEILKISRENIFVGGNMSSVTIDGLDFPKKVDSMLAIEVIVEIEKTFKIKIPDEKMHAIKNIDEIVKLVEELTEAKKRKELGPAGGNDLKDRL